MLDMLGGDSAGNPAAGGEEATGGDGGEPEPGDAGGDTGEETDPFDVLNVDDEPGDAGEDAGQKTEDDGEYVLELGDNFQGTDETRDMITSLAKENGISAEAASKFVSGVCDKLAEMVKNERNSSIKELREEWKSQFDSRIKETRHFINRMLKDGKISESTAKAMQSADAFRFANAVREMLGEKRSAGTRSAGARMSREAELKDIMENPENPHFRNLNNPSSPGYASSAAYFNKLAGAPIY